MCFQKLEEITEKLDEIQKLQQEQQAAIEKTQHEKSDNATGAIFFQQTFFIQLNLLNFMQF